MTVKITRRLLTVNGIVQGVGFRPFVFNLAQSIGLSGSVANTSAGVKIELQGTADQQATFDQRLQTEAPPLAVIVSVDSREIPTTGANDFVIISSRNNAAVSTLISPDVALCNDCRRELFDPDNRRYRYPFINCTNCGPRYTIIENIPYDRPYTSMKHFTLCPDCRREYEDPQDRRFHAQPNACPVCGPHLWLADASGTALSCDDPLEQAITLLARGKIIAVKGLGGFHLAVDARNPEAVARLRAAKGRDEKPFAIMTRDLETARRQVMPTPAETAALTSIQAPIVLTQKHPDCSLAENLAPGNDRLGIMLPYTPLHHLLLAGELDTLVMTSANFSEEPICIDNAEALQRLNGMADAWLLHNRDIYLRSDDSVVTEMAGTIRPLRRSRGYAPRPIFLKHRGPSVLAVGAELKNTVALSKEKQIFLSQHIGDLENLEAYEFFRQTIAHLQRIFEIRPELIVHDLHPEYLSTKWAQEQDIPLLGVQHHHAHLAACMAENDLHDPVMGIILDGTGFGTDQTIWGGEILVGDARGFERRACFEPMPLPGGAAAIREPWRIGTSYLYKAFGAQLPDIESLQHHDTAIIREMIDKKINSPLTSSCGRLFDAVAAISGGRQTIRYEAQAAIEFMQAAGSSLGTDASCFDLSSAGECLQISVTHIMQTLVQRIQDGKSISDLSRWFHHSLILTLLAAAERVRTETGVNTIVLSGGVFQNRLLFEGLIRKLEAARFTVFTHRQVPVNDGGIALGQANVGINFC